MPWVYRHNTRAYKIFIYSRMAAAFIVLVLWMVFVV